jgi:ketosteroid isomerase-like protein
MVVAGETMTTTAAHNKQLMQTAFTELAAGNTRAFGERLADDIRWTIIGTTRWSRTYAGKQTVIDELFRPLFALLADRYRSTLHRIIAEDDHVVIESRGQVMTKAGKPYNNTYCYVCRFKDGKITELLEYCDTALLEAVL